MPRSLFPAERRFAEPPSLADIESIAHEAYGTIPEELLRHVGDVVIHIEDFEPKIKSTLPWISELV